MQKKVDVMWFFDNFSIEITSVFTVPIALAITWTLSIVIPGSTIFIFTVIQGLLFFIVLLLSFSDNQFEELGRTSATHGKHWKKKCIIFTLSDLCVGALFLYLLMCQK